MDVAAQEADDPQSEPPFSPDVQGLLTPGWGANPAEAWYVPADGTAAGGEAGRSRPGTGFVLPDLENRDRAFLTPVVHPAFRRRGIGTEMIAHARRRAAANGRTFIDSKTIQGSAGEAFARRLGAEPGILDARRILDVRTVPAGRFTELRRRRPGTRPGTPSCRGRERRRTTGSRRSPG